jgi:hypothetical protein
LNFGFLYEWGIIIPSPLHTRLIVGVGGYLADFVGVTKPLRWNTGKMVL